MKKRKKKLSYVALLPLLGIVFAGGCYESYVTPAAGADMGIFRGTLNESGSFQRTSASQPTAQFPVTLAVARIQGAGYYQNNIGYCVVNSPLSGTQANQSGFTNLQGISQVVPVNKLLISGHQKSPDSLRQAAASLKAQMLYIYTLDTQQDEMDWSSALSLYTLGLSPTVKVEVRTTAMGMLIDTRTGYVYGVLEARADRQQTAAYMTRQNAWDQCRRITEEQAFESINNKFPAMWNGVLSQYGHGTFGQNTSWYREDERISEHPVSIQEDQELQGTAEAAGQSFWQ